MEHPGRGVPYSIRALGEVAEVPRATIGHLLSGRVGSVGVLPAHALSEALGVGVLVLFAPPTSPKSIAMDKESNDYGKE